MNYLSVLLITSVVVEGLVQYVKESVPKLSGSKWIHLVSMAIAAVVSFGTGANLFEVVGVSINPYLGIALTAVIVSRGSNYLYDIMRRIGAVTEQSAEFDAVIDSGEKGNEEADG